jgi:hypothetical protein
MGWLAVIGTTWFDPVIRSDRDVEGLPLVPVEVAEQQAEAAVGIPEPAFESACNAGAGVVQRLGRNGLGAKRYSRSQQQRGESN